MRYVIPLTLALCVLFSSDALAQVTYPVGTVIEVVDDGIRVTAPDAGVVDAGGGSGGSADSTDTSGYCEGADYSLVDCDASVNFDIWPAGSGEVAFTISGQRTLVVPFTLPARSEAADVRFGYLQLTTAERNRDVATEDVFHFWFSEEPNGEPIGGVGSKCDSWGVKARGNFSWTQDVDLAPHACYLGEQSRVLYANFETSCYAPRYLGTGTKSNPDECNDFNKQKSPYSYQFDVARYVRGY